LSPDYSEAGSWPGRALELEGFKGCPGLTAWTVLLRDAGVMKYANKREAR
jgi:hypothetical protein